MHAVLPSGAHRSRIDPISEVLTALVHDEVVMACDHRQRHDVPDCNIGDVTWQRDRVGIILVCTPLPSKLACIDVVDDDELLPDIKSTVWILVDAHQT